MANFTKEYQFVQEGDEKQRTVKMDPVASLGLIVACLEQFVHGEGRGRTNKNSVVYGSDVSGSTFWPDWWRVCVEGRGKTKNSVRLIWTAWHMFGPDVACLEQQLVHGEGRGGDDQ